MLEVVIEVHNITGTIHLQREREDADITITPTLTTVGGSDELPSYEGQMFYGVRE